MIKSFADALAAGHIEKAMLADGSPFVVDDTQFYQATGDGINLAVGRFHAFGDTLRRHDELKLSDSLMTTGMTTLTGLLKRIRAQATLDTEQVLDAAQEALILLDRMEQRREIGLGVEQVYEIASIFYFSENEDPGMVDSAINRKKINSWLKADNAGPIYSFFLNSPIGNYVPLAGLSDKNTLSYLKELNVLEVLDWTRTLLQLRTNGTSDAMMSTIESRRETLYGYNGLFDALLSPTTIIDQPGSGTNSEK